MKNRCLSPSSQLTFRPMKFSALKLSSDLLAVLDELGFEEMTDIQAQAIPPLLDGKDVTGQSQTGSGKTATYSLPMLQKIDTRAPGVQALIICPTRELCAQVAREIRRLGRRDADLQVLIASGGQPVAPQASALRKGAPVVVGTPGRLVDLLSRHVLVLHDLRLLVLDEADRMLEMGFEEDMGTLLSAMPRERQTALFSATFTPAIRELSRSFQKNPVQVEIRESAESKPDIHQTYYEVEPSEKVRLLSRLLRRSDPDSALIFCNLKATTSEVAEALRKEGFSAEALNGDLEQEERDQVLAKFRNGSVRFLLATDVAARGLDIPSLPLVINYELPQDGAVYVHRVGRTGRAGQSGDAISLVAAGEKDRLIDLQLSRGIKMEMASLPPKGETSGAPRMAEMRTLFIAGGRKDKVRPGDLLGALTGEAGGLKGDEVGKIEIHDRVSFVAVARDKAEFVLGQLSRGRIKGQRFFVKLLS